VIENVEEVSKTGKREIWTVIENVIEIDIIEVLKEIKIILVVVTGL